MKSKNIFSFGIVGALLLAFSSAALASTGAHVTAADGPTTFTAANSYNGFTTGLLIDSGATANVNGSTFSNDTVAIQNNGTVTITGAVFDTDSSIISSKGTTILNSATFSNNSGDLIQALSGTTYVYGATFSTTRPNNFREFAADGGVIDLYGNFGALNGTSLKAVGNASGTFSGILQNDGTTSYSYLYELSQGGVINFLPSTVTATPEPSALTVFAIAGIALAGFAAMRRRVRA